MRQFAFLAALAAASIALPAPSSGGEPAWVAIGAGDGYTDYVDASSLVIRAGRITAWTLTSFATPQQSSEYVLKPYMSMTSLSMYDCSAHRTAALHISFFSKEIARGEVLKTLTFSPATVVVNHAPPGSMKQREIEAVCAMWQEGHKGVLNAANRTPI
jgi:hypothetical protein